MSIAAELRRIDLFDELTDEQLAQWAAITPPIRDVEDGEVLIEQGDPSPGPILLFDGTTRASQKTSGMTDLRPPNHGPTWIGAIAAITEGPLPITIEADGPCRVSIIPRDAFIDLALKHRPVHRKVMHVIAPVMRGINAREASRERLTSLGTMAVGLAHELNNPAAAARRAASELVTAMQVISYALRAFVEAGIEREDAEKLLALHAEALERAQAQEAMSGLDASDAEEAMLDLLEDLGIDDGNRFAEPLAAAGLDGMAKLVKAIKTYAYMDRGEVVVADVHEGLDSTLIMLKHKLKHTSIRVERHYDTALPKLTMHGSELNQVWTNLLDNAIGALGEQGTITITTTADNGCVRVDVADDGPGIPEAARNHVFDPFFTTKAPGAGTGTGLDTARRIVEQRHGGTLSFDTGEGGTVFHVWLPLEAKR